MATELTFYLALPVLAWIVGKRHRGDVDASLRRQLWCSALVRAAFLWLAMRSSPSVKSSASSTCGCPTSSDSSRWACLNALVLRLRL